MKLVLLFSVLASLALGLDCNAKTYCSQFSSCEEAMRYLRECGRAQEGGTQHTDGDGDGVPCEKQLCGNKFSGFSSARDEKSEVSNLKGAADSCGAGKFNDSVIAIKFAS
ncbi:excalibur calcium-binding domain-containing protein [uncultured Campylobacter sp.]|uniref:excalibur calcium-binding domain-containing protein n=1 Tax=uncultured Campylobacter sp. TaxID=218934 RepID=UPI0026197F1D|nr:excalibur calcium-binding domain-containing protein [uncultured Campylobacter sp.]